MPARDDYLLLPGCFRLSQFVVRVVDRALLGSVRGSVHVGDRRVVACGVAIYVSEAAEVDRGQTVYFVARGEAGRLSGLCARVVAALPLLLGVLRVLSQRAEEFRFLVIGRWIGRHHIGSHDHVASDAGRRHTCHC
ncbi:hypothetical protein [Mycobacterium sp.]|uniref:hypothetical protein n=1 Tax=Mycobacterium sp. TaxID=1785 RepID=UPI0025EE15EC|nr:hypothetical protein [Mycobacterium sp.]